MTVTVAPEATHPRFEARRAEVEDQSVRTRKRKLAFAGGLVVAALLAVASTQSPLLDVDEVRVVGAMRKSPEFMREVAAVELGTPLWGLDQNVIEERMLAVPEVADVQATKSWGGVVTIEIAERLPAARIVSEEGVVVIADDGMVLEVTDLDYAELPEISGAMFTAERGARIPVELSDALLVAHMLPSDIATVTSRVELTVDSLVLRLVGGGTVSLGDARSLDDKFDAVRAFLAQVDLSCLETLNVQAPRVPVVVRGSNCR